MLDHLIAIGEATNQTRWPDDLTDIRGIGSQVAERMAGVGITSFSDLAGISDHAKSQLTRGDTFRRFEKRLDAWIDEASKRASEPPHPGADTYLGVVRSCAGGWTDAEGTVRRKLTSKSGNTRMVTFDLFDAPEGHRRSENLAKSLRAVVGAGIGFGEHARIPKLYQRHVDELRLMRATLDGGRTLSKDDLERLNDVVAGSTLELGHPDEYQSVDELMRRGGGVYGAAPDDESEPDYERIDIESTADVAALRESGRTLYATMVRDDDSAWDSEDDVPPPPPDSDEDLSDEEGEAAEAEAAEEEAP